MNIMRAQARATDLLGNQTLRDFSFDKSDPVLRDEIYPTTWDELISGGLIKQNKFDILAGRYRLTPRAWMAVMQLDRASLDRDLGTLCRELKARVNGRKKRAIISVSDIATKTGLDQAFIINAVDAQLLENIFHRTGVEWSEETKTTALRRIITQNIFEDVADPKKWRLKMIVYEHRYKHDGGAVAKKAYGK